MRSKLPVAVALFAALAAMTAVPAGASTTDATFTIAAGALQISAPSGGPVNLGTVGTGTLTLAGQLGNVTVTDTRGALVAAWTANASATNFVTGGGSANETVTNTNIAYSSGTSTGSGTGTFVPGAIATMAAPGIAGTWSGVGNNERTWNPTLTFTLLSSQVAGTYSGTVTHSLV